MVIRTVALHFTVNCKSLLVIKGMSVFSTANMFYVRQSCQYQTYECRIVCVVLAVWSEITHVCCLQLHVCDTLWYLGRRFIVIIAKKKKLKYLQAAYEHRNDFSSKLAWGKDHTHPSTWSTTNSFFSPAIKETKIICNSSDTLQLNQLLII